MYKIGFIDEEANQINIFYHKFKNNFVIYEFNFTQDSSPDDLVKDVFENHLDAVIIDYRINGYFNFNGEKIVEKLNEINPFFPRIILTSHPIDALDFVDDANIVNSKAIWKEATDLEVFIKKLSLVINSYYGRINSSEIELKELEEKRKENGLDSKEEDRYVELNYFLEKILSRGENIPRQFYSEDTNQKLDSLIEKTEQLLSRLSEK